MKIVYLGDNRNRGNYGCRGTSTALSQIISEENVIVGRITGKYTHYDTGELFFIKGLPACVYSKLGRQKEWGGVKSKIHNFFRRIKRGSAFFFSCFDFISLDFEKSINNLINCLPANPCLNELDLRQYDFDALVVNGEGSFIFSTPPWRESLIIAMEMYWAKKLGKKVFFMNAMLSDDPYTAQNKDTLNIVDSIMNKCDVFVTREKMSFDYALRNLPGTNPQIYPDALFSWYDLINDSHKITNGKYYMPHKEESDEFYVNFDFTEFYGCISASSSAYVACHDTEKIIQSYEALTNLAKKVLGIKIYLVIVCEGDEFLNEVGKRTNTPVIPLDMPLIAAAKILANARFYISGRYHPSIMASLGGTPCVFMTSNSHKTLSIQELLEYDVVKEFNVIPDHEECRQIVELAKNRMEDSQIRERIRNRAYQLSLEAKKMKDLIK